jgi:D-alanine-D-alanine ligase
MDIDLVILGGGTSDEREISLRSAKNVIMGAKKAGFKIRQIDPARGLEFLDTLGKSTIILPILHGHGGEDGAIQAELEKRGLPYLGTNSKTSAKCINKWHTQETLKNLGIDVPKHALVSAAEYRNHELAQRTHVLKRLEGGSSIQVLIVRNPDDTNKELVNEILCNKKEALLEELVDGIEITVPILDNKALPVIEIQPPTNEEFDYKNKYNGATLEICPPVSLPENIQTSAKRLAEKVHKEMGCRHFSRVDIIVRKDGSMAVLEINTIPGMTNQSLYPKSAAVAGIEMHQLIHHFVEMVKRDFNLADFQIN